MYRIKSIGNISDLVVPINVNGQKLQRPEKKTSELLREERELLFGNKDREKIPRMQKRFLPLSKRQGKTIPQPINDEEIYRSCNLILAGLHKGGNAGHIKNISDLNLDENKYWLLFVCYILFQCFDYHAQNISHAFNIWRDIYSQANRRFKIEFTNDPNKEQLFLETFDYFMEYNGMEYK